MYFALFVLCYICFLLQVLVRCRVFGFRLSIVSDWWVCYRIGLVCGLVLFHLLLLYSLVWCCLVFSITHQGWYPMYVILCILFSLPSFLLCTHFYRVRWEKEEGGINITANSFRCVCFKLLMVVCLAIWGGWGVFLYCSVFLDLCYFLSHLSLVCTHLCRVWWEKEEGGINY